MKPAAKRKENDMNDHWVNLTPHSIRVLDDAGNVILDLPPSGSVARVAVTRKPAGEVCGIRIFDLKTGEVTGLPESTGQGFIVSALVRQAMPHRADLFSPGELVRGADGQPVGCRGLDSN